MSHWMRALRLCQMWEIIYQSLASLDPLMKFTVEKGLQLKDLSYWIPQI